MAFEIRITARDPDQLRVELHALLAALGMSTTEVTYKGVDSADVVCDKDAASPVEPEVQDKDRKSRKRTPKVDGPAHQAPQPEPEPTPEVETGEATEIETPVNEEEEVKAVLADITAIFARNPAIRSKVSEWRDARGLKWLREITPAHLPEARALLKDISS